MDAITFNTGYTQNLPCRKFDNFISAITYANQVKAPMIVETSVHTFYVKGNETTDYATCIRILRRNIRENFKPNSKTKLIRW